MLDEVFSVESDSNELNKQQKLLDKKISSKSSTANAINRKVRTTLAKCISNTEHMVKKCFELCVVDLFGIKKDDFGRLTLAKKTPLQMLIKERVEAGLEEMLDECAEETIKAIEKQSKKELMELLARHTSRAIYNVVSKHESKIERTIEAWYETSIQTFVDDIVPELNLSIDPHDPNIPRKKDDPLYHVILEKLARELVNSDK